MKIFRAILCSTLGLNAASAVAAEAASGTGPAELQWLLGRWCLDEDAAQTRELWLPAGDAMIGLSQTVGGGKLRNFEYLRIVRADKVLTYIAQPGGKPPTSFKRVDGGPAWVRFENLTHDFPQKIEYRLSTTGLDAQISGPDGKGGENKIEFKFKTCVD